MKYTRCIFNCLLLTGLLFSSLLSKAQVPVLAPKTTTSTADDTLVTVDIIAARKLEMRKINDSTQLQILAGNVKLRQGKTLFDCDSCVINNNNNTFEAWGRVHINDADTTDVYANHLLYLTKRKLAYLDGNVKLTDGKGTLTTPDLEYDVDTKIGVYKNGGKVVNKNTVLTSKEGYYYADLKDVYFKLNVVMNAPTHHLRTDTLLYNTETETPGYVLLNAGLGTDFVNKKGISWASLHFSVNNITDKAYQDHLNRLKYTDVNVVTGRQGVFNMGRNFSVKLNIPFTIK